MSKKIPFLKMFAALCRWTELALAVEGWLIVSAAIDKASRSAKIAVEGAMGAGPNLIREAEEAVCRAYGLNAVKIELAASAQAASAVVPPDENPEKPAIPKTIEKTDRTTALEAAPKFKASAEQDAFARAEAIRKAAMKNVVGRSVASKRNEKPGGRAIYGKAISKTPTPIGNLELDMGTVVVEGDVFAIDNRELKKRGAWVVAFDLTDYTGSIRVTKFFPGDEGKPLADGIKNGMHLKVQGRLNMDRFYGDMVLEPVAVAAAEKAGKVDKAEQKRVELHLHTTMSSMDALTSVDPKLGPDQNVVKRAEAWGHPAIAITDHGVAQSFPDAWHSAKKIKLLYGVEAYYLNDVDDRVAVHGETDAAFGDEIVCFDLETTGLNKMHEVIIEIGAVVLKHGEITDRFNTFVAPGRILSPEIIRLTSITDEMLEGAPSQEEALKAFLAFAGDRPLAAHNAEFDMGFIATGCEKYGISFQNPS
ncbi:MAG: exonuclease domain-containing protein, partial [Lawsonibacter sp.]|nr:exonuclease domain-containing protein [Lawsonibacter sp.]